MLKGQPIGMYHCPYCGAMVLAGQRHLDYADVDYAGSGDAGSGDS